MARRVQHVLTEQIASGQFKSGAYLPTARELAGAFRTSRTTIALALDLLYQDGLISKPGRRGTQVRCPVERLRWPLVGIIHPFYSQGTGRVTDVSAMFEAIAEVFGDLGYPYEDHTVNKEQLTVDQLTERYGAMVFMETFRREDIALRLEEARIPLVIANLEIDLDVSSTCVDHKAISRQAVETLASLGHRRIAFVGCESSRLFYGESRAGYLEGLTQSGIAPDNALIGVAEKSAALASYVTTRKLLEAAPRITAFVAGRDTMAEGVCHAIEEAGFQVGHDISVIGYDNYSWPESNDFLTTFHEPCREMGRQAAQMLVDRVVYGWKPPEKRIVEAPFILRQSAGTAPSASRTLSCRSSGKT